MIFVFGEHLFVNHLTLDRLLVCAWLGPSCVPLSSVSSCSLSPLTQVSLSQSLSVSKPACRLLLGSLGIPVCL
eukprot:m.145527 g.145527  ORF g.145527 m.145527 type:complete len:73 (+) comp15024_c3_seq5:2598-2816(+)